AEAAASSNEHVKAVGAQLAKALADLQAASQWLGANAAKDVRETFAGAVPYLMLWGYTCGGWMMAKSALIAAKKTEDPFYAAKLVTARYYADHALPKTGAYKHEVMYGGASTMALGEEQFDIDRKSLALA